MENFPKAPGSSFVFPEFKNLNERKFDPAYLDHQFTCSKIRAIIKAFPDILRAPGVWRRCTRTNHAQQSAFAEAVRSAVEGKCRWKDVPRKHFEFEIRKIDGEYDVRFVSADQQLDFGPPPPSSRIRPDGEFWKANIIGFGGDLVFTRVNSWISIRNMAGNMVASELSPFLFQ